MTAISTSCILGIAPFSPPTNKLSFSSSSRISPTPPGERGHARVLLVHCVCFEQENKPSSPPSPSPLLPLIHSLSRMQVTYTQAFNQSSHSPLINVQCDTPLPRNIARPLRYLENKSIDPYPTSQPLAVNKTSFSSSWVLLVHCVSFE